MISLSKLLDIVGANLDRIKTIGVLVLITLFITSLVNNGCSRSELESMVEKVTGLNVQNDILQKDVKLRDSVLMAKEDSIKILYDKINTSKRKEVVLSRKYGNLRAKYDDISDILLKIPADASYSFLDNVAYPYDGKKKFPFNGQQIKGIHKTYLENKSLISLNDNLQDQKDELVHQIELQDELTTETTSSMLLMEGTREDLEEIIDNKDEIITIKEKELKKAKRRSFWSKIGIGAGALILGFLAGG